MVYYFVALKMKKWTIKYYVALLCCSLFVVNCTDKKAVSIQPGNTTYSTTTSDQILFLNFKARKNTTVASGETVELVSSQKVPGLLKTKMKSARLALPGELIFSFFTKNDTCIATEIIEDRLTAPVEYSEEDGVLKRAYVDQEESDLFVRLQYNPQFDHVKISKVDTAGTLVFIGKIQL